MSQFGDMPDVNVHLFVQNSFDNIHTLFSVKRLMQLRGDAFEK